MEQKIEAKENLKKIIKIRSRLLKLVLNKTTKNHTKEIEKYYRDCYKLSLTVNILLNK